MLPMAKGRTGEGKMSMLGAAIAAKIGGRGGCGMGPGDTPRKQRFGEIWAFCEGSIWGGDLVRAGDVWEHGAIIGEGPRKAGEFIRL